MDRKEKQTFSEYNLLMNSLDVSVSKHLLDPHFSVVWANDRYYRMFGYTKQEYEARYRNCCDLFFQEDPDDWENLVRIVTDTVAAGGKKYEYVARMPHRDGRKLWIKLTGNFTDEYADGYRIAYTVMVDITDQMQMHLEHTVAYNSFPGMVSKYRITQAGFELLEGNQKFMESYGKPSGKPRSASGFFPRHAELRRGKSVCFTVTPEDARGGVSYLRVRGECLDWIGKDPVYLFIFEDVTELTIQKKILEEKNRQLERLAYVDPVTEGMNRVRFELTAGEAIRGSRPDAYALVWLNLQKYKVINEISGSQNGDRALKYIYGTIHSLLHDGEYVSRYYADNFVLLLHSQAEDAIVERLDRMAERLNGFNRDRKYKYILMFTAGVYQIEDPELPLTQIADRAHSACKTDLHSDKNKLCLTNFYSKSSGDRLMYEKQVENCMGDALANGEFQVYYQPKLSLEHNRIAGAEALVRWNDPVRGLVPPAAFIPIFERNGFIVPLDHFVFEQACILIRRWLDSGRKPVPISVNMSRVHFASVKFLDEYVRIREKYAVPNEYLEIELTETLVFENPEIFGLIVKELHAKGFRCSMDDFGSGYSSLNILKDLRVDSLKLDRAFFSSERMDDARERTVVRSVIELAKGLHMETVAEGVETLPQKEYLREIRCDLVQGYVFSKPVTEQEFGRLLFGDEVNA